ncbi:MAG: hypothetical protein FJX75_20075 [Armatimonadetes bacterium]|nr:hypothetical protein [Armatimonadota bacterium]
MSSDRDDSSSMGYDRLFELQQKKTKRVPTAPEPQPPAPPAEPEPEPGPTPRPLKLKRHTTFHLTIEAHQILEAMMLELRRLADDQGVTRPNKSVMVEALIREAAEQAKSDPQQVLSWYLAFRDEMGEGDGGRDPDS